MTAVLPKAWARMAGEPLYTVVLGQVAHVRWHDDYSEAMFLGDGTVVQAQAQLGAQEQYETAHKLGYWQVGAGLATRQQAVKRMCWEHELVHTLLARARGQHVSPVLWDVAHGTDISGNPLRQEAHATEEAEVLALQAYLNLGRVDSCTHAHAWLDAELPRGLFGFAQEAHAVLGRTRWQPLPYTSNSGKLLFACGTCGRVSPTPDKVCSPSTGNAQGGCADA